MIHIGLPKTGTTSLQEGLFSCLETYEYLGKPYRNSNLYHLKDLIKAQDSIYFDIEAARQIWEEEIRRIQDKSALPFILSEEAYTNGKQLCDVGATIDRLYEVFGEVKILITIRNQETFLKSWYLNHNVTLPNTKIEASCNFDEWINAIESIGTPVDIFRVLDYSALYRKCTSVFGKDNVRLLLFEDYVNNYVEFKRMLADFLNISADELNEGVQKKSNKTHNSKRLHQYKRVRRMLPIPRGTWNYLPMILRRGVSTFLLGGGDFNISQESRTKIHNKFKYGNNSLLSELGLKLDRYKYPL